MKAVIQRVANASVKIDGNLKSSIGQGLLVLLGVGEDDGQEDIAWLVRKISAMRIFDDTDGVAAAPARYVQRRHEKASEVKSLLSASSPSWLTAGEATAHPT